jgi:protein phosphatase
MHSFFDIVSYGISDRGLVRKNNEDAWKSLPSHKFYVLADGMGGHQAGEIAANEAVENLSLSIRKMFSSQRKENTEPEQIVSHLYYAIQDANCWVKQLSEENLDFKGMGTTLCCFLLHKDTLVYAHVGDSRIYRYKYQLEQLSEDHSLKNHLFKKGKLTLENMERYPYKNRITRAIGTQHMVHPDVSFISVEAGDIFFLCSDGLTDHLSNLEIEKIISQNLSIQETTESLVDAAKMKGGRDNITVVMIKVLDKKDL